MFGEVGKSAKFATPGPESGLRAAGRNARLNLVPNERDQREPDLTTTLHLMRHGEVHNPAHILYGRMPGFFLSETGKQQAHAAGSWLADKPLTAIYASPMERAQQTAGIVAAYLPGLSPVTDERIIEVSTPYEGQPIDDLAAMGWDLYTGNQPPHELPGLRCSSACWTFLITWSRATAASQSPRSRTATFLVFAWLHAQGVEPDALMKDRLQDYALPVEYPATASIMTFELETSPRENAAVAVRYDCPY